MEPPARSISTRQTHTHTERKPQWPCLVAKRERVESAIGCEEKSSFSVIAFFNIILIFCCINKVKDRIVRNMSRSEI